MQGVDADLTHDGLPAWSMVRVLSAGDDGKKMLELARVLTGWEVPVQGVNPVPAVFTALLTNDVDDTPEVRWHWGRVEVTKDVWLSESRSRKGHYFHVSIDLDPDVDDLVNWDSGPEVDPPPGFEWQEFWVERFVPIAEVKPAVVDLAAWIKHWGIDNDRRNGG